MTGEAVLQFLVTIFVVMIAPVPWWLIIFHYLVRKESKLISVLSYGSILIFWVVLGCYAFRNQDLIFGSQFDSNLLTKSLGLVCIALAAILDWNVIRTLGFRRLLMFVEFKQEKTDDHFVAHGVYKYARHPRYVEYMLIAASLGFFFGYTFMFYYLGYLIVTFWFATSAEEVELVERFGDTYRDYQKKVKRFFIV